jgi:two-component system, cell cycle sensor histidine kinase and response regulator CckA
VTEDNLQEFVDRLPLGMHSYKLEPGGRLIFMGANSSADAILGLDHRQFIGKTIEEAFPYFLGGDVHFKCREVAVSGKSWRNDEVQYKDQEIIGAFEVNAFQTGEGSIAVLFSEITSRKQKETTLQRTHDALKAVVESSPAAIVSVDRNKKVQTWNEAAHRIFGWSREEVLGQPLPHIPEEKQDEFLALQAATLLGEVSPGREVTRKRRDGSAVELSLSTALMSDANGEANGFMAVVLDITERKRAQAELERAARIIREEKNINDSILDTLPGIFYCFDDQGRMIRWNKAYEVQLNLSSQEIRHRRAPDSVYWEDRERANQAIREVFQNGRSSVELRFLHDSGQMSWYYCTGVRLELGGVPHLLGVGIDITERKRAEEALSESESRFRTIFEMAPDGIFIADDAGCFLEANEAACRQLEHDREQLLQLKVMDVVSPRFATRVAARFAGESMETSGFYESSHIRADGTEIPVELNVSRVTYRGRSAMLGIARDTTERLRAEEERRLLEEQLQHAQRLESVGRLAGGVAHDFNNLLTVINGYSDVLLKKVHPDAPVRSHIEQIKRAGTRAACLTQQLLAFSRMQVAQPKPIDLNTIVAEAVSMLRRLLGENIELRSLLDPSLGVVMADPGQMHQILMNLLLNARDAMPRGGTLTVETKNIELEESYITRPSEAAAGPYAALQVTDTGVGMSEEVRERIFEPFFTTKDSKDGSGLGLSTVYGIVKQNQGWIEVDSEVEIGTTFRIFLPRVDAAVAPDTVAPGEPRQPATAAVGGTETILVVEDQEDVRALAVEVLNSYGYHVLSASSGPDALRLAEEYAGPIHLLLTDVMMPGMTGRDLAEQLAPSRPGMKILYISGYGERVVVHHGILDPGIEYLPKPFEAEVLAAKIRKLIGSTAKAIRILVVDDEECIRDFFREVLVSEGYNVQLAENGREALQLMEGQDVDLVVTDLVMPEREGIETIRAIHEQHPKTKVIATSGAFGGWFLTIAAKLGADATLAKPVQPDQLLNAVRKVAASRSR